MWNTILGFLGLAVFFCSGVWLFLNIGCNRVISKRNDRITAVVMCLSALCTIPIILDTLALEAHRAIPKLVVCRSGDVEIFRGVSDAGVAVQSRSATLSFEQNGHDVMITGDCVVTVAD